MSMVANRHAALFVDRSRPQHWIVRDPQGSFWIVPPTENPWENRQAFEPTDDMDLEPVPGHYRYMLGLPF